MTHISVTVNIRKKKEMPKRNGTFLLVKNDYDQVWPDHNNITRVSRNTRNGVAYNARSGKAVPATARFTDDRFVNFTCDLQEWVHRLCKEKVVGWSDEELGNTFRSCFRGDVWMSNNAGTDTHRDCINGKNLQEGWPQLQPMATGGSLLRFVAQGRVKNEDVFYVEAINPFDQYSIYHPDKDIGLFFYPSMSARWWREFENLTSEQNKRHIDKTTPRQEWYQEPMHFYNESTVMAVFGFIPDPRSSTGWVNTVQANRCRFLGQDEPVPNPWIMRFGRTKPNPYEGF